MLASSGFKMNNFDFDFAVGNSISWLVLFFELWEICFFNYLKEAIGYKLWADSLAMDLCKVVLLEVF